MIRTLSRHSHQSTAGLDQIGPRGWRGPPGPGYVLKRKGPPAPMSLKTKTAISNGRRGKPTITLPKVNLPDVDED